MDDALLSMLNQTVKIAPLSSIDVNGKSIYGDDVNIPARVEYKTTRVLSGTGEDVISSTQTYVNGDVTVTTTSRITLPDGSTPLILKIDQHPDEDGNIYYKVIYT